MMMLAKRGLLAAGVVVAIAYGLVSVFSAQTLQSPSGLTPDGGEVAPAVSKGPDEDGVGVLEAQRAIGTVGPEKTDSPSGRELDLGQGSRLHGRVLGGIAGMPLGGAEVTWTPFGLPLSAKGGGLENWKLLSREAVRGETDWAGRFELNGVEEPSSGVLWASKAGYEPAWLLVDEGVLASSTDLTLPERRPVEVLVEGLGGEPVVGATVVQVGREGFRFGGLSEEQSYASLLSFGRSGRTGVDGLVAMHPGLHYSMLQAIDEEGHMSRALIHDGDRDGGRVVLVLGEPLVAKGRLLGVPPGSSPVVLAFVSSDDGEGDFLGELVVSDSGIIEPQRVAASPTGEYEVRIEGPGIAPVLLGPLRPVDGVVAVSATLEAAAVARFKVSNREGDPIEGAKVQCGWLAPDGSRPWAKSAYYSGSDGLAEVPCPEGPVFPLVSHPDYSDLYDAEGVMAPSVEGEFYVVVLQKFGSIEGVVTRGGKPVPNFTVYRFVQGPALDMRHLNVVEREEGDFSIPKEQQGLVHLFVQDDQSQVQSDPIEVTVEAGETTHLEIDLPIGSSGHGRVMAGDGSVPEGASVSRQLHTGVSMRWTGSLEIPVNPSGEYELSGLSAEAERIAVGAPGYSPVFLDAGAGPDGEYDFGLALLEPLGELDVEVDLPAGVSPAECYVEASGAFWDGPLALDANSKVRFSGAHAGVLTLSTTIRRTAQMQTVTRLAGKGPWHRALDFSNTGEVRVKLVGPADLLARGVGIGAIQGGKGIFEARSLYQETAAGEALFKGLPRVMTDFVAYDLETSEKLGQGRAVPGGVDDVELLLDVSGEPLDVRVIDRQGDPVAGVLVGLLDPDATEVGWYVTTDENGIARLGPAPPRPQLLSLTGPNGGHAPTVLVNTTELSSPYEVVFDAQVCLELDVRDGEVIPEGAQFWLFDAHYSTVHAWPTVGPDGHLSLCQLGEGDYLLEPQSSLLWREAKPLHCDGTGKIQEVQFRRKARVSVAVKDAYGNPVAGVAVGLRSVEYDTDVAVWLGDGRGESATGLVTDANGEVIVSEVPRGVYAWSVDGQAGEIDAPALGVGVVEVTLKP